MFQSFRVSKFLEKLFFRIKVSGFQDCQVSGLLGSKVYRNQSYKFAVRVSRFLGFQGF
jgi:hypothetical protein